MKQTLLIQFREDPDALVHEREAFVRMGNYSSNELRSINILGGDKLPKLSEINNYKSVISGGAPRRDIPKHTELALTNLYKKLIDLEMPTLGICYANHSMALAFGGKLDSKGSYAETGTVRITLTKDGKRSMLFRNLPDSFYAVVGHKIAITKLPKGAVHLAYSKRCHFQAFRLGEKFFGLQFHPELNKDDLIWRLAKYPEYLNGKTIAEVKREFKKTPLTVKIISNFRELEKL